jgi:BASS family bile acid:Na+ symporter
MKAVIQEVFSVLVAVLIPLAAFTTGLRAPGAGQGESRLWRRPAQLGRDLLAILIVVPAWVLVLVLVLPVSPLVRGGLIISTLAVGIGPVAAMKRMGPTAPSAREALDLNIIVLVVSLAFVPIAFALLALLLRADVHLGVGTVAKVVLGRALIPLLLGLGAARLVPRLAASVGPWLGKIVNIALLVLVVVAILATWRQLAAIGWVGWIVCLAAAGGAIVIGHLLGGPDPNTRGVVAAASVMRFPALGLALASVTRAGPRLIPVVIVYVLAAFLALILYGALVGAWRRRRPASNVTPLRVVPRTT